MCKPNHTKALNVFCIIFAHKNRALCRCSMVPAAQDFSILMFPRRRIV